MLKHIRLNRGLDISIVGGAEPKVEKTVISDVISIKPTDFKNVVPKLLVKEGDQVKAGTIVFVDKQRPEIGFASPCSGTVEAIVRGARRKLLSIQIKATKEIDYVTFEKQNVAKITREEAVKNLLESGLWPVIKQRPYGTIASPSDVPSGIFISGFSSAPLSANVNFTLKDDAEYLQVGVDVLKKLTDGKVYLGLNSKSSADSPLSKLSGVECYGFDGPHPVGNVGIQIHHIKPINKGEVVWTVDPLHLAAIGKLFVKGIYDVRKLVAVVGPRVENPCYVSVLPGMPISDVKEIIGNKELVRYGESLPSRYISGNVLSGDNVGADGALGFYANELTVVSEGNYHELFGWAKPIRPMKFSFSCAYFSWLMPKKKYNVDTNVNGGPRAFVVSGLYEKVLPMDIYPVYLLKAILAKDIDKMENLGIYEVIEEDFALCEYVCPSKTDVQQIVGEGIDLMIKEMA